MGCNPDTNPFLPKQFVVFDNRLGHELLYQPTRIVPQNVQKYYKPSKKQIDEMHQNFGNVIYMKCHSNLINDTKCVTNLENYLYQYVGLVIKDEDYIYVNAVNSKHPILKFVEWQKSAIVASDGGNDFWGVTFCLRTKQFSQLSINSYI